MQIATGILVYFMCWWMVWFILLPIGMRTQEEEGDVVPGTPKSAPAEGRARLLKKLGATTVLAAVLWGVYFYFIVLKHYSIL